MDSSDGFVEIWIPIERDATEPQDWERLFATPVTGGFRIDNAAFFAKGIAMHDVVSAERNAEGAYHLRDVISRGGHSLFRIWVDERHRAPADVCAQLNRMGCFTELTQHRLISIDVPPAAELSVREFLAKGKNQGHWKLQTGYSPE